jgi:hypothetical protein
MKRLVCLSVAVALGCGVAALRADDLKSGLEVGKDIPAHQTEKCAGAEEDGVKVGQQLCYV